jgi:hypothetical protein
MIGYYPAQPIAMTEDILDNARVACDCGFLMLAVSYEEDIVYIIGGYAFQSQQRSRDRVNSALISQMEGAHSDHDENNQYQRTRKGGFKRLCHHGPILSQ